MKFFIALVFIYSSFLSASEALNTRSFRDVFEKIQEQTNLYGRENVLIVLDIDNTILTMNNELGSDHWFSWQEEIMNKEGCEPACVTKDFVQLIEYQGILFSIGKMIPTESNLSKEIKELQKNNHKIILLTSRGSEFRSVTEKALEQNGFNFSGSAIGEGVAGAYLPYNLKEPMAYSLTEEDIRLANLKDARPVTYQNGVYMTSGQHKGIMLKVLLNKFKSQFKAIVFVDDHQRHVDRMQAILGTLFDVTTFRYGGVDDQVEKFKKSDKKEVTEKWLKLKKTIQEVGFPI